MHSQTVVETDDENTRGGVIVVGMVAIIGILAIIACIGSVVLGRAF